MVLTTVLSMLRYVSEIEDRDFVDRLHSYFTTNLLIGLSVLVSFKQFGGKPIECLTPDIFSSSWEQYAESYCWAQDTYFVPPHAVVDGMKEVERRDRRISYYQWVPFFLLIVAGCFRLPSLIWKYVASHSGIKIREIVKLSSDPNNIKPEIKRANIRSLTVHLQGALRFHRRLSHKQIRPHTVLWFCNLPYSASFVSSMYLLTKLAYLCNVLFQLLIMNSFLGTYKYSLYGFGALMDVLNGSTWEQSGMFPRVSLCDFEVRVMGNLQAYTIQCVLIINIFNEKIFVFLWFWYVLLLVFTLGSFLFWLVVFTFPCANRRFISRHLEMSELPLDAEVTDKMIKRFIDSFLRCDGVFVVRMLTLHSGVIFGTDLVYSLWQSYYGVDVTQLKRSNSFPEVLSDDRIDTEDGRAGGGGGLRHRFYPPSLADDMKRPGAATKAATPLNAERVLTPPPMPAAMLREIRTAIEDEASVVSTTATPTTVSVAESPVPSGTEAGGSVLLTPTTPTNNSNSPMAVSKTNSEGSTQPGPQHHHAQHRPPTAKQPPLPTTVVTPGAHHHRRNRGESWSSTGGATGKKREEGEEMVALNGGLPSATKTDTAVTSGAIGRGNKDGIGDRHGYVNDVEFALSDSE